MIKEIKNVMDQMRKIHEQYLSDMEEVSKHIVNIDSPVVNISPKSNSVLIDTLENLKRITEKEPEIIERSTPYYPYEATVYVNGIKFNVLLEELPEGLEQIKNSPRQQ